MEARRALAYVMILTGLIVAPFAALGGIDWDFDDDWDHHHRHSEVRWDWHDDSD